MAELVYALGSGSSGLATMRVRVSLSPKIYIVNFSIFTISLITKYLFKFLYTNSDFIAFNQNKFNQLLIPISEE